MSSTQIRDNLVDHGASLLRQPFSPIEFTGDPGADLLLNDIEHYPHAFVLACLMDRQQKAERCWLIPYRFQQKLGTFAFHALAELSAERVYSLMSGPEPLHRFSETMAGVFYHAVQRIGSQYLGDASLIWQGSPSSASVVKRFLEFDGAGPKIATMAANILVRNFKIPVADKYSIDVSADVQVKRVFGRLGLVRENASNEEIIYTARELHPTYPGIFDLPAWEIGRQWCHPQDPDCGRCYMKSLCPTGKGSKRA